MKPSHGIGGQSAVVGYVVLWTGCHAVQQCLETIGLGFAVEKLLVLVCRAILVQLNIVRYDINELAGYAYIFLFTSL